MIHSEIKHQLFIQNCFSKQLYTTNNAYVLPLHTLPALLFPFDGTFTISSSDKTIEMQTEQALLLCPDTLYEIKPTTPISFAYIQFTGTLAHTLLHDTLHNKQLLTHSHYTHIKKDVLHLLHLVEHHETKEDELAIATFSLLVHLTQSSFCTPTPYPPIIATAIELMKKHYTYLYGIEELANQLEMSKHHFIRLFHESVGVSPLQYLTSIKIEHAKILLQDKTLSYELIAISCGFSGADYFRKVFKKETGLSPKQFRDQLPALSHKTSKLPDELFL